MSAEPGDVVLYWRPGCPYCSRLRRDLDSIGLPVRAVDIWQDPTAAARVRSIAGGNETVPTVVVGSAALVNPSAVQVVDAVRKRAPDLLGDVDEDALAGMPVGLRAAGAVLSLTIAVVWLVLADLHPHTTHHLAPLLVAAVWPLALRWQTRSALGWGAAAASTGAGVLVALVATAMLWSWHGLAGPTLTGSGSAADETLVAVAAGAVIGGGVIGPAARIDRCVKARRR